MRTRRRFDRDRGGVLVLVLIMLVLIGSLVTVSTLASKSQADIGAQDRQMAQGMAVCDNALSRAKARLLWEFQGNYSGQSPSLKGMTAGQSHDPWTPTGGVPLTNSENATYAIRCLKKTSTYMDFQLEATSPALANTPRRRAAIIMRVNLIFAVQPTTGPGAGAIVAFGPVEISGNFKVDGRDHPDDALGYNDVNANNGAPAITATGSVSFGGNSAEIGAGSPGGADIDPVVAKSNGVDGTHYDEGTNIWAPEANTTDGIDNDGDGQIDEAAQTPPPTADEYYGKAPGSLKAAAQATGTYFTGADAAGAKAAYEAWFNDPLNPKSNVVIYIEIPNGAGTSANDRDLGQLELPLNPQPVNEPVILVVAGSDPTNHNTKAGPIHGNGGTFQGVLMADFIDKMNGNGTILGQVVSFNTTVAGTIGNGTFDVLLSKEVLGNLPGTNVGGNPASVVDEVLLWREMPPP